MIDGPVSVMGVDLGIRKVALFGWEDEEPFAYSQAVEAGLPRAWQLHRLAEYTRGVSDLHGIDMVWIEDTLVGNNRKYSLQLTEVRGAVMAAQAITTDVRMVNVATWKKQVVGDGHASKDQVKDYIDVTYGAYAALCGDDQDLYDAACIGLYGRQIMERAAHLQLQPG